MNTVKLALFLSILFSSATSIADSLQYSTENGAIDGFDPVSYFTDERAVRGSADITAEWNGAVWHFNSDAHRDLFTADPEKYAPQYGGFCALGMAHGGDVPTDPEA